MAIFPLGNNFKAFLAFNNDWYNENVQSAFAATVVWPQAFHWQCSSSQIRKNIIKIKPDCRLYKLRSKVAFFKAHIWRQSFISKATRKTEREIRSWSVQALCGKTSSVNFSKYLRYQQNTDYCTYPENDLKGSEMKCSDLTLCRSLNEGKGASKRTRKQGVTRENKQCFPCHRIGNNPVLLRVVSITHCSLIKQKT